MFRITWKIDSIQNSLYKNVNIYLRVIKLCQFSQLVILTQIKNLQRFLPSASALGQRHVANFILVQVKHFQILVVQDVNRELFQLVFIEIEVLNLWSFGK